MNLNAEIDKLLFELTSKTPGENLAISYAAKKYKALIRDVVSEITPERISDDAMKLGGNQHDQGYNFAIDQIELNLKKILDNDKD